MKPKVAVLFEIPTPYRQPIFQRVLEFKDVETTFFFLSRAQKDRLWIQTEVGDLPATYLKSWQFCIEGYHTFNFTRNVKELLLEPSFDAYVIGGYAQTAFSRVIRHCWKTEKPYVLVTESHLKKKRPWLIRLLKERWVRNCYQRSAANLVMGSAAQEYVVHYGAKEDRIFRFPNTVDGPSYGRRVDAERNHPDKHRMKYSIKGSPVILFVGTLNRRKGVDLLLEAFAKVTQIDQQSILVMAGQGDLENELRRTVLDKGLQERVVFPGFVQPSVLPSLYAIADIFVLPSLEEPFGAVICEAMAARLPVIASEAVGAAVDYVKDRENGLIVKTGNVSDLEGALFEMVSDDEKRNRMAAKSEEMMSTWTHDHIAHEFMRAVHTALKANDA